MSWTSLSRRGFLSHSLVAFGRPTSTLQAGHPDRQSQQLYWGDLHNHNAVGYATGSLARSIEIAREHLDFFAFTGHAAWHDMPVMPGNRHMKWVNGFRVHTEHWDKTRQMIQDANDETFAAFLGYEWHSSEFGDYCLIFEQDQAELVLPDHVDQLLEFAADANALAIPHHLAYARGWRGANFEHFNRHVSPVVEIFSEHGCSESVAAPVGDYVRHSMGGRATHNTVERQLAKGMRFGFVASSDDHRGYPGAYGEGLVAIWAPDGSTRSLMEAIRRRRTYAVTGDRIELDMTLNGQPMGAELPFAREREIDVRVAAPDSIKMIELVRNGRVIERHFPEDDAPRPAPLPGRVKCRLRYGWGPWAALDLGRTCDWDLHVRVEGAQLLSVLPCFQAAPYDEQRRDRLQVIDPQHVHLRSHTSRVAAFAEDPTKSIVLEIDVQQPDARLTVELLQPTRQSESATLQSLQEDNAVFFTGGFTSESWLLERLVGASESSATLRWNDSRPEHGTRPEEHAADSYFVRVLQHNQQMAWSSPVWVG